MVIKNKIKYYEKRENRKVFESRGKIHGTR